MSNYKADLSGKYGGLLSFHRGGYFNALEIGQYSTGDWTKGLFRLLMINMDRMMWLGPGGGGQTREIRRWNLRHGDGAFFVIIDKKHGNFSRWRILTFQGHFRDSILISLIKIRLI